jgi:hypothetical protein
MDASPFEGYPAQAMEAQQDYLRGAKPDVALQVAANARRWWRNSGKLINAVLTIRWADQLGMPRLA